MKDRSKRHRSSAHTDYEEMERLAFALEEDLPEKKIPCSDVHEWLIFSVCLYLRSKGSLSFLVVTLTHSPDHLGRTEDHSNSTWHFPTETPFYSPESGDEHRLFFSPKKKGDIVSPRTAVTYFTSKLRHSEVSAHLSSFCWLPRWEGRARRYKEDSWALPDPTGFCGKDIHFIYYSPRFRFYSL